MGQLSHCVGCCNYKSLGKEKEMALTGQSPEKQSSKGKKSEQVTAYFKKKNYEKAAELMEKVVDMVPGEAISLDHLGDIYFAMNRKREASYFWKQAKDLANPEDNIVEKIEKKLRLHNAS